MKLRNKQITKGSFFALTPLMFFFLIYITVSFIAGDFYKISIGIPFLFAAIYAVAIVKCPEMSQKIEIFSRGATNLNILMMIWIFILSGAFAQSAKAMGAIDATVDLTLRVLPPNLILPGIFIAACFISLSIGTSVGTIVALTPVAVGIAEQTHVALPFMVALVVGGAFFGDNLSFISDTTIAATKTQGCMMRDKFKVNIQLVLPAVLPVFIIYLVVGWDLTYLPSVGEIEWIKVIPYLLILVLSVVGLNVLAVLTIGLFSIGMITLFTNDLNFVDWFVEMGKGITGMGELIIVTLMAGGMLETIRYNGGIDWIITKITHHVKGKRGAEFAIAGLVGLANLFTANNTIAIITTGPIAKDLAIRYGVDLRKSASILDTFSCCVQGLIPYGAQILIAAGLSSLSPISIIEYLYYPMILGVVCTMAILFRYPWKYSNLS